jgi:drug/metabolite transporter (DMT)-like permease
MFLLLALAAAAAYGAADFLGGVASRRAASVAVIVVSQSVGLVVMLAAAPALSPAPGAAAFAWGAAAGVAYGLGVLLLYRGLAMGRMSVVAPITAVCALAFPVLFGLLLGEHPGGWALLGIALALPAIVLVSSEAPPAEASPERGAAPGTRTGRAVVLTAIGAGAGMGLFFICLARTQSGTGLWPLVAMRGVVVGGFAALALGTRQSLRLPRPALVVALGAGAIDVCANTLYLLSTRGGMLSLVATLTALYPATTVLLASLVLRERIRGRQAVGFACATLAAVLITATQ